MFLLQLCATELYLPRTLNIPVMNLGALGLETYQKSLTLQFLYFWMQYAPKPFQFYIFTPTVPLFQHLDNVFDLPDFLWRGNTYVY